MDAPFPFGFPTATAFYLTLYVLTLVVHVVFMNYVVAGTAYLAWRSWRGPVAAGGAGDPIAEVLRDWMPFALSAAITAGVAPLLFVQILYQRPFYTANQLLFHRWMAILPVLIVGFYLLYLLKSGYARRCGPLPRGLIALGAAACFLFTGWSWTENHLLSLRESSWPRFYESGRMMHYEAALLPRLGVWMIGSLPTMAMLVGWQLHGLRRRGAAIESPALRRLAWLALVGIAGSATMCVTHDTISEGGLKDALLGPMGRPWAVLLAAGVAMQIVAWAALLRRPESCTVPLSLAAAGVLLSILGMSIAREILRIRALSVDRLFQQHEIAMGVGGWWLFVLLAIVNIGVIAWAMTLVRRGLRTAGDRTPQEFTW
ncbi:MAG: hypothetical protein HUU22_18355 [Phycisphaerae bacterium]|nr:hypothetical protein [Phycisphaerae bacterium]NUQ47979.1 hypothetical protein [Phycisphaerae bacterium]